MKTLNVIYNLLLRWMLSMIMILGFMLISDLILEGDSPIQTIALVSAVIAIAPELAGKEVK